MESQYNVYSVFDVKAMRYGPLFEATNDEIASREFANLMQRIQPLFRPEYKLICVGVFDFVSGDLRQNEPPKQIPVLYDIAQIKELREVVK